VVEVVEVGAVGAVGAVDGPTYCRVSPFQRRAWPSAF